MDFRKIKGSLTKKNGGFEQEKVWGFVKNNVDFTKNIGILTEENSQGNDGLITTRIYVFLLRKFGFNQGRFGSEKQLDTKKIRILPN